MPIKFRCEHCQQLLGISRTKAGQVADCPTCGRSVRVPELDGRRDPVPPPQLDLKDTRLAGALNELAQIGLDPDERAVAAAEPDHTSQKAEIITREPLPNPEPIEPAVPLQNHVVQDVPAAASRPARTRIAAETAGDALAELARQSTPAETAGTPPPATRRRAARRLFSPLAVSMLVGGVVVGLTIGYLIGKGRAGAAAPAGNGNGSHTSTPDARESAGTPGVKGRITYKNEDGESRPDRKARVLVFPQERLGQRKLDITGLRAGDSPDDFRSAAAAFRALGGDVALVDDDGAFQLSLAAAGTYHVLVLSNYQPRDPEAETESQLTNLLGQYFERPEQLLGRVAYRFDEVRYKGAEPVLLDHSF